MPRTHAQGGGTPPAPTETRRDFLYLATGAAAAFGTAAALWPFIDSMNPAADVRALSATEVDLEPIQAGQRITVKWRGQPVFIARRTEAEIAKARDDDDAGLPDPEPDSACVRRKEWLIVVGVCTHLGCIPLGQKSTDSRGEWDGWFWSGNPSSEPWPLPPSIRGRRDL